MGQRAVVIRRIVLLPRFRIRQEAHRQHDTHQHRRHYRPEGGLFIVQHRFDPGLDPSFTESQRTGGHPAFRAAAIQQRLRISGSFLRRHIPHHPLIAGQFHIPTEAYIRRPDQRIIPIHCQQHIAQQLPDMIPAPQVGTFMQQDTGPGVLLHAGGQVDVGSEHSQKEGGLDLVAEINIILHADAGRHLLLQPHIAHKGTGQHNSHAHGPQEGYISLGEVPAAGGRFLLRSCGRRFALRVG